jgi:hypothetical protein
LVFCLFALIALYTRVLKKRNANAEDGSKRLGEDQFYDEDGVYDANAFEQVHEELDVLSYSSRTHDSEHGHLQINETTPKITPSSVQMGATSPDDDPDTQDLWLDVPKIA